MGIRRVFVEKKPGFDVEARHMRADIRENLAIDVQDLRLLDRYDVQGLDAAAYAMALNGIFALPNVDAVFEETLPVPQGYRAFAMTYLPGQYDQRSDSAMQCIQMLTQGERPQVATAKVIMLKGVDSEADFKKIIDMCINPIESCLSPMEKPDTLDMRLDMPPDVPVLDGFTKMDEQQMKAYHAEHGFAMDVSDLLYCRDYFRDIEKRDPTQTEIKVLDTYWSDHCRHTTYLTRLTQLSVQDGPYAREIRKAFDRYHALRQEVYPGEDRPMTLMDMATIAVKAIKKRGAAPDVIDAMEQNACIMQKTIYVDGQPEDWHIQFKNETHNHPTEIEPFGGAATCLGGAIRDILAGRAYVHQAMRITGSGDPRIPFEQTIPGKLPQRTITRGAAKGFSSYGNQIGLATGMVHEIYDPGYMAKRMEIGAVIGACPASHNLMREPGDGDIVVLLGGATGRDGIGGATGSSQAHDVSSIETCGSQVQKGNPLTERKIQRLFRRQDATQLIKRCNDFGAGGVCVAIGELSDGVRIELDKVPKKYEGLDGTELAVSESQERMAVVLAPETVDAFIQMAHQENLDATPVATVTRKPRLTMLWRGKTIVDIDRAFLDSNGVSRTASALIETPDSKRPYFTHISKALRGKNFQDSFMENLQRLNVCAQKGLVEHFDSTIGAGTVLMPYAGERQVTPEEAMVSKVPVLHGKTQDATAMSFGFNVAMARWSPFHAGMYAVVEALSRLLCVGVDPLSARLSFQEYFQAMTQDPAGWGKPAAALLGALCAQDALNTPSIGGKDSMSGTFENLTVPPTLVCFAVGMTQAEKTISAAFIKPDQTVVLLRVPMQGKTFSPDFESLKTLYQQVYKLMQVNDIHAAGTVREGGVAAAVTRMCLGNQTGFVFSQSIDDTALYTPLCGALVLSVKNHALPALQKLGAEILGHTTDQPYIQLNGIQLPLKQLEEAYMQPLNSVFPVQEGGQPRMLPPGQMPLYTERSAARPTIKTVRPRVLIPVFPGTNCEYDTARAFERAGAVVETLIVQNRSPQDIEHTTQALAAAIARAQILMLPGGFSAGDEPGGSGKFIATTLRNPRVSDALQQLLAQRDGLMLGICNGFQALIQLGLVPYGAILPIGPDAPTLTYNAIGRHISRMVYTRVTSVKSPWFYNAQPGQVHAIPISHGEGRFTAPEHVLRALFENGQVAAQYSAPDGTLLNDSDYNPNGSDCMIEGITSPDGRILGKMGHSERIGDNICKNVPGDKNQKLFESGVAYFL